MPLHSRGQDRTQSRSAREQEDSKDDGDRRARADRAARGHRDRSRGRRSVRERLCRRDDGGSHVAQEGHPSHRRSASGAGSEEPSGDLAVRPGRDRRAAAYRHQHQPTRPCGQCRLSAERRGAARQLETSLRNARGARGLQETRCPTQQTHNRKSASGRASPEHDADVTCSVRRSSTDDGAATPAVLASGPCGLDRRGGRRTSCTEAPDATSSP